MKRLKKLKLEKKRDTEKDTKRSVRIHEIIRYCTN